MLRSALVLASLPLVFAARDSRACSCMPPAGQFVTASGELPSDAVGVVWSTGYRADAGGPAMKAERLDGDKATVVPVTVSPLEDELVLVRPTKPMKPGERYRFSKLSERDKPQSIEVSIGKVALGPLLEDAELVVTKTGRAQLTLAAGASCRDSFDTDQAKVVLRLPDAAKPYLHALLFTTAVDSKAWRPRSSLCSTVTGGRSWQGLGDDIVFAKCAGRNAATAQASEGVRSVAIQASLPGTPFVTAVAAQPVTLSCK